MNKYGGRKREISHVPSSCQPSEVTIFPEYIWYNDYLCMQNKGSRYLNPSNGPREQPVTNLKRTLSSYSPLSC